MKDKEKIIKKRRTSSAPRKFAQFLLVLVIKSMVKKNLISDRFDFLIRLFFRVSFDNSMRSFLYYLVKKESVILRSLSCFNPYFPFKKYKHKHCKETEVMVYKKR